MLLQTLNLKLSVHLQTVNLNREVRRERILDNRNKALKVQEKQAAMLEKVTGLVMTRVIMMMIMMMAVYGG